MHQSSRIFWMLALILTAGSHGSCSKSKGENSALRRQAFGGGVW